MNKTHTPKDSTTAQDATGDSGDVVDLRPYDETDTTQKRIHDMQDRFLVAYGERGTITGACAVIGLHRDSIHRWRNEDRLGFKLRFKGAQEVFRESLERIMFDRLGDPGGNRGSDILLIFALKAHWRDKYGDESRPIDDSARTVLNTLIGWRKGNGAASS
jgi:hypothetical protein